MTTATVCRALLRRWYIVLAGLAATIAVLAYVHSRPVLYFSQVEAVFLAPKSRTYPNSIKQTNASVIAMAGLIAADVSGDKRAPATASSGVTLAGEGVHHGYSLMVPNSGGQWAVDFERPVIIVQVIGPDADAVRSQMSGLLAKIRERLEDRQAEDGTGRENFITVTDAPAQPPLQVLAGHPRRALAMTASLGVGVTLIATTLLDLRMLARRPSGPSRSHRPHRHVVATQ